MPEYGMLTQGTYGCPVGCKYCVVTEVERRNTQWRASSILGVNKSVTILNPPPDLSDEAARRSFYEFPLELLRGDIVGFNGISDPFWPKFRAELDYVLAEIPRVAKILSLVTKFEVTEEMMVRLAEIPNVRLTVSITGLDQLENTSTKSRLRTLARAKRYGVRAFPIVHPYISGMSDLSFLPELRALGYDQIDLKGLRCNPQTAKLWMPADVQTRYQFTEDEELPEDGWRESLSSAGFTKVRMADWYKQDIENLSPHLPLEEAEALVDEILRRTNVCSSDSDDAVRKAAIARRL